MNIKRAIVVSILLWVIGLIMGSVLFFITGRTGTNNFLLTTIGLISLVVFSAIAAHFYFKGEINVVPGIKQGFLLGIIFVVVGVILDSLAFISFVYVSGGIQQELTAYYVSPAFALGIIPSLVGYIEKYRPKREKK